MLPLLSLHNLTHSGSCRTVPYNAMVMHKWYMALQVMQAGVNVLVVDSDVVMMRNPLPLFDTLPVCDMMSMMEYPGRDNAHCNYNADGLPGMPDYGKKSWSYMNTGYTYFRA
jgi:hypothetical protein